MAGPRSLHETTDDEHSPKSGTPANVSAASLAAEQRITGLAILLGAVASIGGFMFGYVR